MAILGPRGAAGAHWARAFWLSRGKTGLRALPPVLLCTGLAPVSGALGGVGGGAGLAAQAGALWLGGAGAGLAAWPFSSSCC